MIIEIEGNKSNNVISITINDTNYLVSNLIQEDVNKVNDFISLLSLNTEIEKYICLNHTNDNIKITFDGESSNSQYYHLLDVSTLSENDVEIINKIINL